MSVPMANDIADGLACQQWEERLQLVLSLHCGNADIHMQQLAEYETMCHNIKHSHGVLQELVYMHCNAVSSARDVQHLIIQTGNIS